MKFSVSTETAILCVKFFIKPIVCWPPPLTASKSDLAIRDVLLVIALSPPVVLCMPLMHTIRISQDNVIRATQTLAIMIALLFTIFKMIMCRYQRRQLQIYYAELHDFIRTAGDREKALLERYMNRCGPLYTFIGISAIATFASFACGPLVLPQPLPADVVFPFAIENHPKRIVLLYIGECLAGCQAISAVIVDIEVALLLWYFGIRFELLGEDFTAAKNLSEFNKCIKRHQTLLISANELILTIRYIVLGVVVVTILGNICTGYQFVHHQPIAVVAQFFFMLSVMCTEVLMYAWPADNLMTTSSNIAYAAYSSEWFRASPKVCKTMWIVMMRAQKPLVISIGGLLPELDLDFYGKYLTTSFSYFTTLQAVAG